MSGERAIERLEHVQQFAGAQPIGGEQVEHRLVGYDPLVQVVGLALRPKAGEPFLGAIEGGFRRRDVGAGGDCRRQRFQIVGGLGGVLQGVPGRLDGAVRLGYLAGQAADQPVGLGDCVAALFELGRERRRLGRLEPGFGKVDPAQDDKCAAMRARHSGVDVARRQRRPRGLGLVEPAGDTLGKLLGAAQQILRRVEFRGSRRQAVAFRARHRGGADRRLVLVLGARQGGEQIVFVGLIVVEIRAPRRTDA